MFFSLHVWHTWLPPTLQRGCVPWSRVPRWGLLGTRVPWQGPPTSCRKPGSSFVCLMPPGKAHCFSTLGELPRLGALAAPASQQVGRLASSRGIQASQVGSCCWIRVCSVIKTCKVSLSLQEGSSRSCGCWDNCAGGGAVCAGVALLASSRCPLGFPC